jgi:hypothetical protein
MALLGISAAFSNGGSLFVALPEVCAEGCAVSGYGFEFGYFAVYDSIGIDFAFIFVLLFGEEVGNTAPAGQYPYLGHLSFPFCLFFGAFNEARLGYPDMWLYFDPLFSEKEGLSGFPGFAFVLQAEKQREHGTLFLVRFNCAVIRLHQYGLA